jgi:hypothetical protein
MTIYIPKYIYPIQQVQKMGSAPRYKKSCLYRTNLNGPPPLPQVVVDHPTIYIMHHSSSAMGSASHHLHHSSPWVTFHPEPPGHLFFISWSGTHAHSHIYQIHAHIFDSLQILFTLGIWLFMCAGTCSSFIGIIPSGIYSALACSLSPCIAFTFPVTPSDIGL